jgi:hypothetical protein
MLRGLRRRKRVRKKRKTRGHKPPVEDALFAGFLQFFCFLHRKSARSKRVHSGCTGHSSETHPLHLNLEIACVLLMIKWWAVQGSNLRPPLLTLLVLTSVGSNRWSGRSGEQCVCNCNGEPPA